MWAKIPFWLYLLVTGLGLIGFVTYKEIKKSEQKNKKEENKEMMPNERFKVQSLEESIEKNENTQQCIEQKSEEEKLQQAETNNSKQNNL